MVQHGGHGEHGGDGGDGGHGGHGEGHADDAISVRRGDINRIDLTITALLAERMRIGQMLGRLKRSRSQPPRSETREAEVLVRVRAAAAGPLSPSSAARIFQTIIEETAACQERDGREEDSDA
jgi:chorismate mutase